MTHSCHVLWIVVLSILSNFLLLNAEICPKDLKNDMKGTFMDDVKMCVTWHEFEKTFSSEPSYTTYADSQLTCSSVYPGRIFSIESVRSRTDTNYFEHKYPNDVTTMADFGDNHFYNGIRIVEAEIRNGTAPKMRLHYRTSRFKDRAIDLTKTQFWQPKNYLGLSDSQLDGILRGEYQFPICLLMEIADRSIRVEKLDDCNSKVEAVLCEVEDMVGCVKSFSPDSEGWYSCSCKTGYVGKYCEYELPMGDKMSEQDYLLTVIIVSILCIMFIILIIILCLIRQRLYQKYQRRKERMRRLREKRRKEGEPMDFLSTMASYFTSRKSRTING